MNVAGGATGTALAVAINTTYIRIEVNVST